MNSVVMYRLCVGLLAGVAALQGNAGDTLDMHGIEQQQLALQQARDAIAQRYDSEARQCWQRFMVNDCLQAARLQRRRALLPIDQQEHVLRAAKRALAVAERQNRLEAKQPSAEVSDDVNP